MSRATTKAKARQRAIDAKPSSNGSTHAHDRPANDQAEWDEPIALDTLIDSTPFPLDFFPEPLARYVESVAKAIGKSCPIDYPAVSAIGCAAGACGGRFEVEIKPGYKMFGTGYFAIVAPTATGKTAALTHFVDPFEAENKQREKEKLPSPPILISDLTTEALGIALADEPRGVLYLMDELASFFLSNGRYSKNPTAGKADMKFFLSAWSHRPIQVIRVGRSPRRVSRPALTILGGIQPAVFAGLQSIGFDGIFDRIVFCYPPPPPAEAESRAEPDANGRRKWTKAIAHVLGAQLRTAKKIAYRRPFSPSGWKCYEAWSAEIAALINSRGDMLRGPLSRLKEYAARLALVSDALRSAYGGAVGDRLDEADVANGVKAARYFVNQLHRVLGMVGEDQRGPAAQRILDWLKRRHVAEFTEREVSRSSRAWSDQRWTLADGLKLLVERGWLRKRQRMPSHGGTVSDVYDVHPCLYKGGPRAEALPTVPTAAPSPQDEAPQQFDGVNGWQRPVANRLPTVQIDGSVGNGCQRLAARLSAPQPLTQQRLATVGTVGSASQGDEGAVGSASTAENGQNPLQNRLQNPLQIVPAADAVQPSGLGVAGAVEDPPHGAGVPAVSSSIVETHWPIEGTEAPCPETIATSPAAVASASLPSAPVPTKPNVSPRGSAGRAMNPSAGSAPTACPTPSLSTSAPSNASPCTTLHHRAEHGRGGDGPAICPDTQFPASPSLPSSALEEQSCTPNSPPAPAAVIEPSATAATAAATPATTTPRPIASPARTAGPFTTSPPLPSGSAPSAPSNGKHASPPTPTPRPRALESGSSAEPTPDPLPFNLHVAPRIHDDAPLERFDISDGRLIVLKLHDLNTRGDIIDLAAAYGLPGPLALVQRIPELDGHAADEIWRAIHRAPVRPRADHSPLTTHHSPDEDWRALGLGDVGYGRISLLKCQALQQQDVRTLGELAEAMEAQRLVGFKPQDHELFRAIIEDARGNRIRKRVHAQ